MPTTVELPLIVLLSDDLLFPSRIREALRPEPVRLKVVGEMDALRRLLETERPSAIIVNLTARRYDPPAAIRELKSNPNFDDGPIIAFAGHVEADKHAAAREAGATSVVANSTVSLHLPAVLKRMIAGVPDDVVSADDFDGSPE